jgi:hypothetical protein
MIENSLKFAALLLVFEVDRQIVSRIEIVTDRLNIKLHSYNLTSYLQNIHDPNEENLSFLPNSILALSASVVVIETHLGRITERNPHTFFVGKSSQTVMIVRDEFRVTGRKSKLLNNTKNFLC